MKIGFIGAGNMALAIAKGMIASAEYKAADIMMSGPNKSKLDSIGKELGVTSTTDNDKVASECDIIVLSVKPQMIDAVLAATDVNKRKPLIISVMAGITTASLAAKIGNKPRIVRTMPNTPLLIQKGVTALCAGEFASEEDMAATKAIFDCAGSSVIVKESQMDAVGAISGSGPAYFFMILEALSDAGVKAGLPRALALELAVQTAVGSATMLTEMKMHPAALKDMVTSPGGTTIEALNVLEGYSLRAAFVEAVEAAVEKSKRL